MSQHNQVENVYQRDAMAIQGYLAQNPDAAGIDIGVRTRQQAMRTAAFLTAEERRRVRFLVGKSGRTV